MVRGPLGRSSTSTWLCRRQFNITGIGQVEGWPCLDGPSWSGVVLILGGHKRPPSADSRRPLVPWEAGVGPISSWSQRFVLVHGRGTGFMVSRRCGRRPRWPATELSAMDRPVGG